MTSSPYTAPGTPTASNEPPLWAPYYGAPFKVAVQRFFKKYATFSGRASRSEYWWWMVVSISVSFVLNFMTGFGGGMSPSDGGPASATTIIGFLLAAAWVLAVFVPSIALTIRRLHDANLSGWFLLLALIPVLGGLALLVMTILPSNPSGQRFDRPEGF